MKKYMLALLSIVGIAHQALPVIISAQIDDDMESSAQEYAYPLTSSSAYRKQKCTYYPEDNKVSCTISKKAARPATWEKIDVLTTSDKPRASQNVIGTYQEPATKTTMYVIRDVSIQK